MTDDVKHPDLFDGDEHTDSTEQQFEQVLARLEEIVNKMEGGGLPLAESLNLFEEGAAHIKTLNTMLADVRETVLKLVADQNGNLDLEAFPREETQ